MKPYSIKYRNGKCYTYALVISTEKAGGYKPGRFVASLRFAAVIKRAPYKFGTKVQLYL